MDVNSNQTNAPLVLSGIIGFLFPLYFLTQTHPPIEFSREHPSNIAALAPSNNVTASPDVDYAGRKIEKVFNKQGHVFSETNLFSDRNNGFYRTYHSNGKLATETIYKDGWEVSDKAFDDQGKPVVREGTVNSYYADGIRASSGRYHQDKKEDEHRYYYYDGRTVVDVWHYLHGRRVGIHVRNDRKGNFLYQEDWGYPAEYVQHLYLALMALLILLASTWLLLLFKFCTMKRK